MNKTLFICCLALSLASCTIQRLPPFSSMSWHIDSYSGNAKSDTGLEFGFGCEWMITDTALIQTSEQIASFPKLAEYLTQGIRQFRRLSWIRYTFIILRAVYCLSHIIKKAVETQYRDYSL